MQEVKDSTYASRSDTDESQGSPKLWLVIVVALNVAIVLGLMYALLKDVNI